MNKEEYKKWETDARRALSGLYASDEINLILAWFRSIKGQAERDLIGSDKVDAMLVFVQAEGNFDVYNSMMARLFIYAPLILRDAGKRQQSA